MLPSVWTEQRTSPIAIDEDIVREVQEASDRATRYGSPPKKLGVGKAIDRSFTAAAYSNGRSAGRGGVTRRLDWIRRCYYPAATFGVGATLTASLP